MPTYKKKYYNKEKTWRNVYSNSPNFINVPTIYYKGANPNEISLTKLLSNPIVGQLIKTGD